MDRYILIASTICFFAAVVHTVIELRAGVFRPMRLNFFAIGLGFLFQTAFLWIRGQELGRCPITNLFEVFVFLAWSVALVYMLVGPAYRLSLMGAFTAPLVLLLQGFALYTVGIVSGFFTGHPLPRIQVVAAIALWVLYAAILQARHLKWLAPKRVAALCIIGFSAALALLWGITFSAELHHMP